jgi:outer membrane cobalamin receptor
LAQILTYIRSFILFLIVFHTCNLLGQSLKDTLHLSQFEVTGSFTQHNEGFKKIRLDSSLLVLYSSNDLATLLTQHSTVFIKTYGNGSLSTPSFRGTTANHTQVQWNGISINSPMLGQTDLSQVPVSQFESLEILYGAATVARTSGAFGGIINLVSNPDWNNKANVLLSQTFASFSNYTTNLNLALGNNWIQSVTKINYSNALNNFPYYNDQTFQREKLVNAMYVLAGITQETFFKVSPRDIISARVWYSDNYHQIPPITTNTEANHSEAEKDQDIKSIVEWKRSDRNYYFIARSSLVDQYMNYVLDQQIFNHHSYSWVDRFRFVYTGIKNFVIKPGIDYSTDWVKSTSYDGLKSRNVVAAYSEFNYNPRKHFQLSAVIRQEMVDGKFKPFIPALGAEYKPFNSINLTLNANICRNYRIPTLNDLYFMPYGNPTLTMETDYSGEGGLVYNYGKNNDDFFIEASLTSYYSKLENLIIWFYTPSGEPKPLNISEVNARGIESGLNIAWSFQQFRFALTNAYNYCLSTNQKAIVLGDNSIGKQLIYTPVHTFNSTLLVTWSGFFCSYSFVYSGVRYTNPENTSYMPGYSISNIILGKKFHLKKNTLSLQLNFNNLFDLDYQSIVNRPMPGRNYELTLKFHFSK